VVPVTESASKDGPTHTVVLNPGFAIAELIRCEREGERPQPQYCLSGDEYKQSGWKGVYAKARRRFVYLAQKIYAPNSGYDEQQIRQYEESWHEHLTRLLAPAIKTKSDVDQDYLARVSTRNPTSLAWVIKISLELDKLVKADKFTGSQQTYVGVADKKARKRIFPSANTLIAIKSTMCFSLPDVYHLGLKGCERCTIDIRGKGGLYGFWGKRKIGKTGFWVLTLPCAQRMCGVKGLGISEEVVGTGNCFHCPCFAECPKNKGYSVTMSIRAAEKLLEGIPYLEKAMDQDGRRQIAKDKGNMVLVSTGLTVRSNSDDSRRVKAAIDAGTYTKVDFGLGTSHEANASQEIDDDESNDDDDLKTGSISRPNQPQRTELLLPRHFRRDESSKEEAYDTTTSCRSRGGCQGRS